MRLPEGFNRKQEDEQLDPALEAELAVIDAALAGGPVPDGEESLAQLTRELRAERAEPDPDFAARLDRWAADGFRPAARPADRRRAARARPGALERLRSRLASTPPRRLIAPVGAFATLAVVVGVAISQGGGGEDQAATGLGGLEGRTQDEAASGAAAPSQKETGQASAEALRDGDAAFVAPEDRKVARSAQLTLAAEPEDVTDVADGVTETANRYRAIVVSSSVRSGDGESNTVGADFELRVPAAELQPFLADLSELASVQSQTEGAEDITPRFTSAEERIDELNAERESILAQLADAQTQQELDALRGRLDIVNSQLSAARAELDDARERIQLVPVSVSVVSEEGAGDDGDWGIDEAIDDAGRILSAAAGVIVVAGAVLLPLAIVGALLALILRGRTHRSRERTLDE